MGSVYKVNPLGFGVGARPRTLTDVQQQMQQIERQFNGIPFPELATSPLAATATVTSTVAAVTGLRHRIKPTRQGQLMVAFAWVQAIRTAGAADLQLHFRVQNGAGTPVAKSQTLASTAALLSGVLFTSHETGSVREHILQVYGGTGAAGTTWQVLVGSSVTVLTV